MRLVSPSMSPEAARRATSSTNPSSSSSKPRLVRMVLMSVLVVVIVSSLSGALLPLTLSSLRIPETDASPLGHFFDLFLEPREITRVFRARPAPHPPPSSAAAPRRAPPQHSGAARVHRRVPTPVPRTPARRSEVAARRREPQPHREPRHAGHGA